ncbi:MAG: DAK2 domain-containing protein [Ardenticatenaceae bacterium]|nr:DAK2 domain-containing protein [Ardenticatenaceae bacterium]
MSENIETPSTKWLQCNGQQLRKMAQAGLIWLEHNKQHVNELNVFPVPDGDTGINMLLTMQSAYKQVQGKSELHVGKVASELAHGAMMGSRGNSGVILSQIWRGLAKGFKDKAVFTVDDLAVAFREASETAYNGVTRPVEGTILTVIREGAEEAEDAAKKSRDLRFMLERVLERCQQALERTPELLPILKEAGVVDSGGQGLVYILVGMLRYAHGQMGDMEAIMAQAANVAAVPHEVPAQALAVPEGGQLEFPYDVQFILTGQNLNVQVVRDTINAMGDSTVVVGDERTIKVHVHVVDPGVPISYAVSLGAITDVVVENMQEQMEDIVATAVSSHVTPFIPAVVLNPDQIGVVAVAAGSGLAAAFRSLGVAHIVNGGQTNNPSTEEILQAIDSVPTNKVIVLPNNKNIILAAEAARDLSHKEVAVIPSRTVPQGISALMFHDPDGDLVATTAAMTGGLGDVSTGEITRAIRSVTIDEVAVTEGEFIGLVDGRLRACESDLTAVLIQVLEQMNMDEREIVSLYYGQDVSEGEATAVAEQIEDLYPDVEVEVINGGQAHYYYILGAE